MKKKITFLVLAMLIVVGITSCNDEKNAPATVVKEEPKVVVEEVRIIESTIGWGALTPQQQENIIAIGKAHPFGGQVQLVPAMDEVVSVQYLEDVPSSCTQQTLIEYTYHSGEMVGTNKILVQGHLSGIKTIASIPDLLNSECCCYKFGGCIKDYECTEPLPAKKVCKPCQQVSAGVKQADGVAGQKSTNSSHNVVIENFW